MEEADLIIYFKTKEGHFSLVTVLKTNTKGSQERCPGQLEHGLHMLVVGGGGEGQLHMAGGLHEHLGSLRYALQLHIPQDLENVFFV